MRCPPLLVGGGEGRLKDQRPAFATAKMPSLHPSYRLLHVLVHIDGTVDHHQPDHRDRDKPNNQRCHVSSPNAPASTHQQNSRGRNCGMRDRSVPARNADPSCRHLAKRDVLSGKANVEPEHWSMGAVTASTTPRMLARRPLSIEY